MPTGRQPGTTGVKLIRWRSWETEDNHPKGPSIWYTTTTVGTGMGAQCFQIIFFKRIQNPSFHREPHNFKICLKCSLLNIVWHKYNICRGEIWLRDGYFTTSFLCRFLAGRIVTWLPLWAQEHMRMDHSSLNPDHVGQKRKAPIRVQDHMFLLFSPFLIIQN